MIGANGMKLDALFFGPATDVYPEADESIFYTQAVGFDTTVPGGAGYPIVQPILPLWSLPLPAADYCTRSASYATSTSVQMYFGTISAGSEFPSQLLAIGQPRDVDLEEPEAVEDLFVPRDFP